MPSSAYAGALRETLRATAAAYGYTLSTATTITALSSVHGSPGTADLFLFAAGGLAAFAGLELSLLALGAAPHSEGVQRQQFPLAGALDVFAVPAALGSSIGISHALHSDLAWLLAPLAATAVYMLVVAAQLRVAGAVRR